MIIKLIKTQRALSPTSIELADYVINPYTGCQFGCAYCYSRSNKNVSKVPYPWGKFVFIKENLPELLIKELKDKTGKVNKVLIGSTTDPFQPIEKDYRITKTVLQILRANNIPAVILTKSTMIKEYLDLLDYSGQNTIYFTYYPEIMKKLFGCHYLQKEALNVIEEIYKSNTGLVVYISPVFPGLISLEDIFEDLKGRTKNIYFENYNTKQGNWHEIKEILKKTSLEKFEKILSDNAAYSNYWNNFIDTTKTLNTVYGYDIKHFIHPFQSYYPVKEREL